MQKVFHTLDTYNIHGWFYNGPTEASVKVKTTRNSSAGFNTAQFIGLQEREAPYT